MEYSPEYSTIGGQNKMKDYCILLRIKHYVKNLIIFIPMFFGGVLFDMNRFINGVVGFVAFSMAASAVYVFNDLLDVEKDRNHPVKKDRPLASGKITKKRAVLCILLCLLICFMSLQYMGSKSATSLIVFYVLINIAYSLGLKNVPILDIVILSLGFIIRLFLGGVVTDVVISKWLFLVVMTGSFYMGLGKRRNELKRHTETRKVLRFYTDSFLDKNMYVCVALANVFYALWASEILNTKVIWTVPVFIVILMRYSLVIEGNSEGDPVDVIAKDYVLQGMTLIYSVFIFMLLYF